MGVNTQTVVSTHDHVQMIRKLSELGILLVCYLSIYPELWKHRKLCGFLLTSALFIVGPL